MVGRVRHGRLTAPSRPSLVGKHMSVKSSALGSKRFVVFGYGETPDARLRPSASVLGKWSPTRSGVPATI